MIPKKERDNVLLGELLDELETIDTRITGGKEAYFADANLQDAISMRLIVLGELLGALSDEFNEEYPELPAPRVRGLRNVLAHAYGKIDFVRLWSILETDYPKLSEQIRQIASDRNVR